MDCIPRHRRALSDVGVPSYFDADVRLVWHVTRDLELSIMELNLVHVRHAETSQSPIQEISRSVFLGARWKF